MKMLRARWSCIALLPAAFVAASLFYAFESRAQQSTNEATLGVGIKVGLIAQIEFQKGNGFELYIPSRFDERVQGAPIGPRQAPHLDIAEIPFEVRSNSRVTVEALPGEILGYLRGEVIGRAYPAPSEQANIAAGAVLPYRLRVEFPAKTRGRAVPGLSNGSGLNPTGSNTSTADAAGGTLPGIVYVIPDVKWGDVASHRFKVPGLYKGMVQITVSAGD